ncbi:MAG TPA: methyltransferase domain-containing protein [Candidatus Binatia bacterium]|jgi:SAM-dependent methyltransferase|nr:methyltransferase domain-containing protein [Candidatus Binatia bacterium]
MKKMRRSSFLIFLCAFLTVTAWSGLNPRPFGALTAVILAQDSPLESKKIVPFVPTPQEVVDRMIELAGVKKGDVVYDLGSGDGRIVITAAKKGARAVGFEIDPDLIKESRENVRKAGVEKLAEIRQQDILTVDLSGANVVTMYLLPDVNLKLKPNLLSQLKPGSRVVSHAFDMGDWKPDKTERVDGRTVYLWTIPAKGASKK